MYPFTIVHGSKRWPMWKNGKSEEHKHQAYPLWHRFPSFSSTDDYFIIMSWLLFYHSLCSEGRVRERMCVCVFVSLSLVYCQIVRIYPMRTIFVREDKRHSTDVRGCREAAQWNSDRNEHGKSSRKSSNRAKTNGKTWKRLSLDRVFDFISIE